MKLQPYFLTLKTWQFNLIYALFTLLAYNYVFFGKIHEINAGFLFLSGSFILLFATLNLILNILFCTPKTAKIIGIALILLNSVAFYFMTSYNVLIDKIMLLNVIRTDVYEAGDVIHLSIIYIFLLLGLLPAFIIYKTRIISAPWKSELKIRCLAILLSLVVAAIIILPNLKTIKNILGDRMDLRYSLIPSNYIGSFIGITKMYDEINRPFTEIAQDAKLNRYWKNGKKNLIVLIVGETARAANFSLGGYSRPTNEALNPYLKDITYYSDFYACGTSTAVSVPCMFSKYGRKDFKTGSELYTGNLIDVMEKSGYKSLWRDNNTSCQNNCDRIELEVSCSRKSCQDDVLLNRFSEKVRSENQDMFVILHQRGSHGPDYFKRYPENWQAPYQPVCTDPTLKSCSYEELVNAYDNSIYYSSIFFTKVINELQKLSSDYNTVMIYASDHGESLGENGMYLHAFPYNSAPSEQTHIPALVWMPEKTADAFNINRACLKKNAQKYHSHDNLFHSILGLAGISTSEYQSGLDIFAACRTK